MRKATFPLLPMVLLLAGCPGGSRETPPPSGPQPGRHAVIVLAAASTLNALDEIKLDFAKSTGIEVRTSYAASSALARQIENGAEADLFLSADLKWADYLEAKVPVVKRRNLLGNRLVVVVPSNSKLKLSSPDDLLAEDVKHLALGDPDAVPAGRYAKQALIRLGLWERLRGKVAPAEDVRHALTYVETAAAEAGVVYATDAAISSKVKVIAEIPAEMSEPVRYPLLLLGGDGARSAEAFYDYLGSPAARRVFEKYGFTTLEVPSPIAKPVGVD